MPSGFQTIRSSPAGLGIAFACVLNAAHPNTTHNRNGGRP